CPARSHRLARPSPAWGAGRRRYLPGGCAEWFSWVQSNEYSTFSRMGGSAGRSRFPVKRRMSPEKADTCAAPIKPCTQFNTELSESVEHFFRNLCCFRRGLAG